MYIRVYCSYGRIRVYVLVSISRMCVVLCLCSVLLPKYICAYVGESVTLVYIVCYCLVGNFPEVLSPSSLSFGSIHKHTICKLQFMLYCIASL